MTTAVAGTIGELQQHAESIKNDATKVHESFEVGDVAAQGDLHFVAITSLPGSAKPRPNRQLADGDTQGSRHVLRDGEAFDCEVGEVREAIKAATGCDVPPQYIGPVFHGGKAQSYVEHPEHGDQQFPSDCVIATTYQRTLDREEREMRVQD